MPLGERPGKADVGQDPRARRPAVGTESRSSASGGGAGGDAPMDQLESWDLGRSARRLQGREPHVERQNIFLDSCRSPEDAVRPVVHLTA